MEKNLKKIVSKYKDQDKSIFGVLGLVLFSSVLLILFPFVKSDLAKLVIIALSNSSYIVSVFAIFIIIIPRVSGSWAKAFWILLTFSATLYCYSVISRGELVPLLG